MWTAPRTWVTSELVTSTIGNSHWRDNLLALDHPYYLETADKDVTNTIAETSLFTAAPTVTGGDLGTNGRLILLMQGDFLWNNVVGDTVIFRAKLGGTTVIQSNALAPGNVTLSAARFAWLLTVIIGNRGATGAQLVTFSVQYTTPGSPVATTGVGGLNNTKGGFIQNTSALDTTVNQPLDVTAQWAGASVNDSWRVREARVLLGKT